MNIELAWLPWALMGALAFFAAGWLVARLDLKQLLIESRAMPQSYFKGLNFLLNEQQDKAIEAFIEVTKANPEAVELQFALGSLFRKRGEVDRAIHVHQNLSERGELSVEQRTTALIELAIDYQKSGLLDHTKKILSGLAAKGAGTPAQQAQTLRLLLDVHVQEKNWLMAIDAASRLDAGVPEEQGATKLAQSKRRRYQKEIAHFYCELASEVAVAAVTSDSNADPQSLTKQANDYLDSALIADPSCVRANLMRGEWQAKAGNHAAAITAWHKIEQQDPAFLGLAADRLLESYRALGDGQKGLADLRGLQQHYPALDLLNAIFDATLASDGPQAAYELVKADLRNNPTLVGLDRLLEAQILAAPDDRKHDLQMLKELVHSHSSRLAVYLCKQCGFKAKQFYWQCPACGGWETFSPRRTAEYDTANRHLARSQIEG
jgi:lipopolysaccharide assembly protein B